MILHGGDIAKSHAFGALCQGLAANSRTSFDSPSGSTGLKRAIQTIDFEAWRGRVDRLNILHLVSYSLYSGPVSPTLGLALEQRRGGHQVSIACDAKRGNFDGFEEPALPRLEASGLLADIGLTLSTKSSPLQLMRDVARLRARFTQGDLDILHVHMSHDHTLATVARQGIRSPPRVVRTFHASRSLEDRLGQGLLNRSADGWIVRTQGDRDRVLEKFSLPAERTRLISGSVDTELFVPSSTEERARAKRELGLPEDSVVLGHVALIADRGQRELLDALDTRRSTQLHLMYVGRGQDESAVRAVVEERGLSDRVHFAGYLRDEALLRAYSAMDAAFVAGPGNDASVRAALEAMSCGLPVIGVRGGAVTDYLEENRGYLVDARDGSAIAAAIDLMIENDVGRERGLASRQFVQRSHAGPQEAQATFRLYLDCLGR